MGPGSQKNNTYRYIFQSFLDPVDFHPFSPIFVSRRAGHDYLSRSVYSALYGTYNAMIYDVVYGAYIHWLLRDPPKCTTAGAADTHIGG